MKKLLTILFLAIILFACQPQEKVVIIQDEVYTPGLRYDGYKYKVKRIEKGVISYVFVECQLSVGDTILYRFQN